MPRLPNGQRKELIGVRMKPQKRKQLERMAKRNDTTVSGYAARILDAHIEGMVYCEHCGFEHEIPHISTATSPARR